MAGYFDHNATTPLDERVLEAMLPYLKGSFANPSSIHRLGRLARTAIEAAREQVAAVVNVHPSQVIFTSGATEANNAAIMGVGLHQPLGQMLFSSVEHASVQEPMLALNRHGWQNERLPVDAAGRTSADQFAAQVNKQTRLVSVMWANNETGVINDIGVLAKLARDRNVLLHTDAVQAAGKLDVDFPASGAHLMSLSAHKMYGPKGVGALIIERGLELEPLLRGGGQEKGRRGGTENVAGIVGFGKAAELAVQELATRQAQMRQLRERFEAGLRSILRESVIFAEQAERLANTVFMAVPGIDGETLIMALDRLGFAVSAGAACGSDLHVPSTTLMAMGVDTELARCAVRVSLGVNTTEADVDGLLEAIKQQVTQLQGRAATAWA
ncbi:MAG TPA: cysteine desulfurase family protein [Gammaproteobacteria bacterium]